MGETTPASDEEAERGGASALRLVAALALPLLFLALTAWRFRLGLDENDDAFMMRLVSGAVTGSPTASLVYSHRLLGGALAGLFTLAPSVNWYGLYLLGAFCAAVSAIAFALLEGLGWVRGLCALVAAWLLVWLDVAYRAQFTLVAVWLGVAASVLTARLMARKERASPLALVVIVALAGLAALVRFKGAILGVGIASPLLLITFASTRRLRPALALVGALAVGQGLWLADGMLLKSDATWARYLEDNAARAALVDSEERGRLLPHVSLQGTGWKRNDVKAMRAWVSLDRELYSKESFEQIRARIDERETTWAPKWRRIKKRLAITDWRGVSLCLLIVLAAAHGRRRELLTLTALHIGVLTAITLYLAYFGKFVDRTFKPPWFGFIVVLLAWWALRRDAQAEARWTRSGAVGAALLSAFIVGMSLSTPARLERAQKWTKSSTRIWSWFHKWVDQRLGEDEDRILVDLHLWEWANAPSLVDPGRLGGPRLVTPGWMLHSPPFEAQLEHLGIDDLLTAIVDDDRVRVLLRGGQMRTLKRYYKQHRGWDVRFVRRGNVNKALLYEAVRDGPAQRPPTPTP
jgi:hypothetical protein